MESFLYMYVSNNECRRNQCPMDTQSNILNLTIPYCSNLNHPVLPSFWLIPLRRTAKKCAQEAKGQKQIAHMSC